MLKTGLPGRDRGSAKTLRCDRRVLYRGGARDLGRLPVSCDLLCDRRVNQGHVARFAFDGVAENNRKPARRATLAEASSGGGAGQQEARVAWAILVGGETYRAAA